MNLSNLYDKFFSTYPIYQRFQPIASFRELHDWLWNSESIAKMLNAVNYQRPAIEGVVLELEDIFDYRNDLSFNDDFTKKATGMLIKYVLGHFGYVSSKQKDISKGKGAKCFTSGMHYQYEQSKQTFRLVNTMSIVNVNELENFDGNF